MGIAIAHTIDTNSSLTMKVSGHKNPIPIINAAIKVLATIRERLSKVSETHEMGSCNAILAIKANPIARVI